MKLFVPLMIYPLSVGMNEKLDCSGVLIEPEIKAENIRNALGIISSMLWFSETPKINQKNKQRYVKLSIVFTAGNNRIIFVIHYFSPKPAIIFFEWGYYNYRYFPYSKCYIVAFSLFWSNKSLDIIK